MIRSQLKWLVGLLCLAAVIGLTVQQQRISGLRSEIDAVRASDQEHLKEFRQATSALSAEYAKKQGLWHMAAGSLATAASEGNAVAVGALSHLAANGNEGVRQEAVQALEMAVAKQQPLALQALQKLGWRQ